MATKLIISRDGARAVYDDRWVPIYQALGQLAIARATDVEYNPLTAEWTATYRPTGNVIAHGKMRNAVIDAEIQWLEREVIR